MMPRLARTLAIGALALSLAAPAPADVSLRWQQSTSPGDRMLADYLVDSHVISDFVELVSANFAFDKPFVVAVGTSGGPDYDPASNTVRLPYAYIERAVRTQASLLDSGPGGEAEEALAVRRALDVVEYTLYHLLGHALAGSGGIEVDELAEGYSTWAMLAYWPDGAAQWREVSTTFARASQRLDGPLSDYWHAHGLFAARERILDCWTIGREPALASTSPRKPTEAEALACREDWETLDANARRALEGVLLDDAPLRLAARGRRAVGGGDEGS